MFIHQKNDFICMHEYFEVLYLLLINNNDLITKQLYHFINSLYKNKYYYKDNFAYYLFLLCIQNHSIKDKKSLNQQYIILENILKVILYIYKTFNIYANNNNKQNITVIDIFESFLDNKRLLCWSKLTTSEISVIYFNNEDLLNERFKVEKFKNICVIRKEGRLLQLHNNGTKEDLRKKREISNEITEITFKSTYSSIANAIDKTLNLKYCPLCNPNENLPHSGNRIKDDCSIVLDYICRKLLIQRSNLYKKILRRGKNLELSQKRLKHGLYLKDLMKEIKNNNENLADFDISDFENCENIINNKFFK